MTIGQRIAQKRKELGLSQEALGEKLGVSRQAIYKWESDTSLPEIDKLIAMSQLFHMSIGTLLGVESGEGAREHTAAQESAGEKKLSEEELLMVREIVEGYIKAQPKPKRRRWPWVLLILLLMAGLLSFDSYVDQMDQRINYLQSSIGNISSNVNSQIGTITDRVEEVLKNQNDLTADYGAQITGADLGENTISFTAQALPKTYAPGMTAVFIVESDGDYQEFPARREADGRFRGELSCKLSNSISISVAFVSDSTRQTQLLDSYSGLYYYSQADIGGIEENLWNNEVVNHLLRFKGQYVFVNPDGKENYFYEEIPAATISDLQVGLFVDGQLKTWLEPYAGVPDNYVGFNNGEEFYRIPDCALYLEDGQIVCFKALITDNFGRQYLRGDNNYKVTPDSNRPGETRLEFSEEAPVSVQPEELPLLRD